MAIVGDFYFYKKIGRLTPRKLIKNNQIGNDI